MITQGYVNGQVSVYNTILYVYRHELAELREDYYEGRIRCNQYRTARLIILQHIKLIKNAKNDLKLMIKHLNNQPVIK